MPSPRVRNVLRMRNFPLFDVEGLRVVSPFPRLLSDNVLRISVRWRTVGNEGRICFQLANGTNRILDDLKLAAESSPDREIHFRVPDVLISAFDAKRRTEGRTRASALRQLVESYVSEGKGGLVADRRDDEVEEGQKRAVFFRLSAHEVALAKGVAENFGGITAWAAGLVRTRLGTKAALVAESERAALVESSSQLKRIGINLNQIAHCLNRDERYQVRSADLERIREVCREVKLHSGAVDRLVYEVMARGEGGDGEI